MHPSSHFALADRKQSALQRHPGGPVPWLSSVRAFLLLAFCCLCLVFAVYSRSLEFQFILDDHNFTADPRIQSSGHVWDYFANYVWAQFTGGPPTFYRPVFLLWMRINFELSALSPWGWHLLSIAKHVLVSALLGVLVWKLLRDRLTASGAAILFALHPAQTESVSWVTVPDPLMAAGLLGALLIYLRYAEFISARPEVEQRKSPKPRTSSVSKTSSLWLIGSAGLYLAALLSKETAIIFPAVIFGIALCIPSVQSAKNGPPPFFADFRPRLAQALRLVTPFLCVAVLYLLLRFNALGSKFGLATQHLLWRAVMLSWPAILWF